MTVRGCINAKSARGRLTGPQADQLEDLLDEFERAYQDGLGPDAAARRAALEAADAAELAARRKKRLAHLAIAAQDRARTQILSHPKGAAWGVMSMLTRDPWQLAPWHNVDKLRATIRAEAHALWSRGLDFLGPQIMGFEGGKGRNRDVLRALWGDDSVPVAARDVANAWREVSESLRRRFNEAGGAIPYSERWRLPQSHDAAKVGAVSYRTWRDFVTDRLDRDAMLDDRTGLPLSDARLEAVLREVYETVSTGGLSKVEPSGASTGLSLANRRADRRVLHFREADGWIDYQEQFGTGSAFEAMTDHIERMANDIAWLEVFGPNPEATRRYVEDLVQKAAVRRAGIDVALGPDGKLAPGDARKAAKAAAKEGRRIFGPVADWHHVWDDVAGTTGSPVNPALGAAGQNVRSLLVSAQLGSAVISAISDSMTTALTAYMNGIPPARVLARTLRQVVEPSAELNAVELGLLGDDMARIAGAATRFGGEILKRNLMSRLADITMRASLLRRWTQAGRHAFGLEFAALLGRNVEQPFEKLPAMLQESFARYGLGADSWDVIRAAPLYEPRAGARFLRPMDIAGSGLPGAREAAIQLHRMILTETDYAVVSTDPLTRAIWHRGTRAGSAAGEVARAVAMYKSFPTTVITTHLMRMLAQPTAGRRMGYAAVGFIGMSLFGMLAFQGKQIARGRDPVTIDPSTPEGRAAWAAGVWQGGGLGIIGDFFFTDQSRFGQDLATTIAGPAAGLADDVLRDFLLANLQRAARGEETEFTGDALWLASRYAPGSSIWYLRLALEREVFDQAALAIDPDAPQRFRRIQRDALRDYGSAYWLPPGRSLRDARAPDFDEVLP